MQVHNLGETCSPYCRLIGTHPHTQFQAIGEFKSCNALYNATWRLSNKTIHFGQQSKVRGHDRHELKPSSLLYGGGTRHRSPPCSCTYCVYRYSFEMAQGFGKDQIQEQWKQCRYYSSSTEISTFACKDFSAIDIDGFWSRERDLLAARTEAQKFGRAPLPTEVYFPGQERPGDSESRAQFYFRRSLFRRTSSKFGSLIKLDEAFSNLVHARFKAPPSKITEEVVVDRAFDLLSRLPATPLPLPNPPRPPEFVEGDETYGWLRVDPDRAGCSWESLDVVRTFAKPVIWMALAIAVTWDRDRRQDGNEFSKESHAFRKFINSVSDLIESISYERKPNEEVGGGPSWRWFVLKAYLWSTWQRCISLHYW